jgi:tRNA (guanine-N7-)-methyltransferase
VWLEIGFGGAEHLIWQAVRNPEVGIIGCEPYEDGVVKALSKIEELELTNIRIHADDARPVLKWLPGASLARAFILFPDPWPKKRHHKRRLLSFELMAQLAHVMRPDAELRIATDVGDYAATALMSVQGGHFRWCADCAADWRERGPDWPETRYERRARDEGRKPYFLRFRRR